MKKNFGATQIIPAVFLVCVVGLAISWIAGISPYGYDMKFFHFGLFITLCTAFLMGIHLFLKRSIEQLGYLGALLMLFLVFGYIPLRLIYWSIPETWILVVFPGLAVFAVLLPYLNPKLSGKLEKEYLVPSTKWGQRVWWGLITLGPFAGTVGVVISRLASRTNDYMFLSILGLIAYLGMLWTLQANVHKNIYVARKKKEEERYD